MEFDTLQHKLKILTDAAKYDASCSSSGSRQWGCGQCRRVGNLPQLERGRTLHFAAENSPHQ